ncbi:MAG: DNA repair exonuclease [Bdellovibrionales bacterium]|nr:DNA repair exonuclease [Bdellovibrionales bacterium]
MSASARILCIGDVHLGRAPTRLRLDNEWYEGLGPREALRRAAREAIELQVDVVVCTGDVIDQSNAFFEAHRVLRTVAGQLTEAGIPFVAISGNHDYESLPECQKQVPGLTILGRNGSWEEFVIVRDGTPLLRLLGRSFTDRYQKTNPLEGFDLPADGVPSVGLLHCDVDVPDSPYAPVDLRSLLATAPSAWLLGHVHKPQLLSTRPLILYPGSLQGLDPGEPGVRGPWLVEVSADGQTTANQLPLAPVRYERLEVAIDDLESIEQVSGAIAEAVSSWRTINSAELRLTRFVSLRLVLTGSTTLQQSLAVLAARLTSQRERFDDDEPYIVIDKVLIECSPRIDLATLARSNDVPGLLAKRLLVLKNQNPHEAYRSLIEQAGAKLANVHADPLFSDIAKDRALSEVAIRDTLIRAGTVALHTLLAQQTPAVDHPSPENSG